MTLDFNVLRGAIYFNILLVPVLCQILYGSDDRVGTILPPFAAFAHLPHPNIIEQCHGLADNARFVGQDACLEVAGGFCLHADACACQVGTPDINFATIEDQHLKVHPRTKNPLQPVVQQGIFIEILPEGRAGFFGVDEAHLHSLADKSGQSSQKGFLILAAFHVQVLDVGSAYP